MTHLTRQQQLLGLAGWLVACFIVAAIGSAASIQAGPFYAQLIRPEWAPPPAVFGPVWTMLYTLMAISAWLVWRVDGFAGAKPALLMFLAQLLPNALWSWLFFAWNLGGPAFFDILLMLAMIMATQVLFWRISRLATVLLIPYLLWVSFAAALNFSLWQLNPQLL